MQNKYCNEKSNENGLSITEIKLVPNQKFVRTCTKMRIKFSNNRLIFCDYGITISDEVTNKISVHFNFTYKISSKAIQFFEKYN